MLYINVKLEKRYWNIFLEIYKIIRNYLMGREVIRFWGGGVGGDFWLKWFGSECYVLN